MIVPPPNTRAIYTLALTNSEAQKLAGTLFSDPSVVKSILLCSNPMPSEMHAANALLSMTKKYCPENADMNLEFNPLYVPTKELETVLDDDLLSPGFEDALIFSKLEKSDDVGIVLEGHVIFEQFEISEEAVFEDAKIH